MKLIESHFINKSDYGIVTLIINTAEKWVTYNHYNSIEGYQFVIRDPVSNQIEDRLTIPNTEFPFDLEKEYKYIELEQQNKDQVTIHWIPLRLFKGDEFVQRSKLKLKP